VPLNTYNTRKQLEQNQLKNQQILLRCSQPLSNKQTPHPTTKMKRHHHLATGQDNTVLSQDPTVCLALRCLQEDDSLLRTKPAPTTGHQLLTARARPHASLYFVVLLRKEVIQPHLPVRLPCYDFVPIADPTFDSSPHKGWATGFGCYRLS
jgi:hypothetical protein